MGGNIVFVIVVAVSIYLFFYVRKSIKINGWLGELAKTKGLNIIQQYTVVGGVVGLDDTLPAIVWIDRNNKENYKLFTPDNVRSVEFSTHKSKSELLIVTNDAKNPTLKLDFGIKEEMCKDFCRRIEIAFNLK